jgi:hypothetical protein
MVENVQPAGARPAAGARESARDTLRGGIEGLVTQGKDRVVGRLGDLAGSIRHVGDRLSDQQVELLARYADQAATRVEEASDYLRERDLDELLQDTRAFARRRPEIFVGGAFVVGLLVARFLKSSAERVESAQQVRGGAGRRKHHGTR